MKLVEMQREFRHWLVASSGAIETRLDGTARPGLAVYQNNYRTQLIGCLQMSYPLLRTWLGDDAFLRAAITHVDRRPPHAWTLDAYGADFGDTLRALFPRNPDVHELAWIEWALSESFVAADVPPMPGDELGQVDWDSARLRLSPSLRLRALTTNADAIWSALQQGAQPPESAMLAAPAGLLVWRQGFTSRLQATDVVAYAALQLLRDDDGFDSLCDALVEHLGEEAGVARAGTLLANWLAAGIVAGVEHGTDAAMADDGHDLPHWHEDYRADHAPRQPSAVHAAAA
ncbi:HvfC/BufC family peptide modification chaperone [Dyella soli]|uniref:DUF2063 domain-containing protein n=1 Tax=Dyella soli TaxID=522319 RepID=A0A4R0YN68_9GAMM|nr:putative DNA-binding domain-containing protein [Dyella soli]TCI07007.1 DUF2063 domain-containing protein [Dyella soli]